MSYPLQHLDVSVSAMRWAFGRDGVRTEAGRVRTLNQVHLTLASVNKVSPCTVKERQWSARFAQRITLMSALLQLLKDPPTQRKSHSSFSRNFFRRSQGTPVKLQARFEHKLMHTMLSKPYHKARLATCRHCDTTQPQVTRFDFIYHW